MQQCAKMSRSNAGKVLGLRDVAFLGYPDGYLEPTLDVRRDIAREIRRYKPDVLICQYPLRVLDGGWGVGHPDHLAAGEAALAAVFPTARDHMTFPSCWKKASNPTRLPRSGSWDIPTRTFAST